MRKLRLFGIIGLILLITGCGAEADVNNFNKRKDSYIISEDKQIVVEYKTDEEGKLVELLIDRLLTIEEMVYYNTQIDYDYELAGFGGDIYTEAGFLCTDFEDLFVPINIEIGNTRFKYDVGDCEYVEVDRDNDEKVGSFVRSYELDETIDVSRDTIISVVVFDDDSIERFIEITEIPHTMKMLGVYSIGLNADRDGFSGDVFNYYKDMAVYEQLMLKHQVNEDAINEVLGISSEINLLEFDQFANLEPLIDGFETRYSLEIQAIEEMVEEVGVITEEVTGEENEEDPTPGDEENTDN